jgi:hypothetical protein
VPAAQLGQAEAPAAEYEPAAQEPLAAESPAAAQKLPATHKAQLPIPDDGW